MSSVNYLSTQLDKMLRFMRNPKKKSNTISCMRAVQVQVRIRFTPIAVSSLIYGIHFVKDGELVWVKSVNWSHLHGSSFVKIYKSTQRWKHKRPKSWIEIHKIISRTDTREDEVDVALEKLREVERESRRRGRRSGEVVWGRREGEQAGRGRLY